MFPDPPAFPSHFLIPPSLMASHTTYAPSYPQPQCPPQTPRSDLPQSPRLLQGIANSHLKSVSCSRNSSHHLTGPRGHPQVGQELWGHPRPLCPTTYIRYIGKFHVDVSKPHCPVHFPPHGQHPGPSHPHASMSLQQAFFLDQPGSFRPAVPHSAQPPLQSTLRDGGESLVLASAPCSWGPSSAPWSLLPAPPPSPSAGDHWALLTPESSSAAEGSVPVGEDLSWTSPCHNITLCCLPPS